MDFGATKSDLIGLKSEMKRFIKIQSVIPELISLKARYEAAQDFCLNQNMHVECRLLEAQIKALEEKLDDYKCNRGD